MATKKKPQTQEDFEKALAELELAKKELQAGLRARRAADAKQAEKERAAAWAAFGKEAEGILGSWKSIDFKALERLIGEHADDLRKGGHAEEAVPAGGAGHHAAE